jgi:cytochrome c biogenesis protein CcdA
MFSLGPDVVLLLVVWVLGLVVLYWVIRLAVRHAIADADGRRDHSRYEASTLPRRPAGRPQAPPGS